MFYKNLLSWKDIPGIMTYLVGYLHEEARDDRLANARVVLLRGKLGAASGQGESVHDSRQLLSYIIGTKIQFIADNLKKGF